MRMPKRSAMMLKLLAIGCLMVVMGCQHAKTQPRLQIVEKNAFSARGEKRTHFIIVSERADYDREYRKTHADKLQPPALPEIDFSEYRVLMAFLGQRSTAGYGIDFLPNIALSVDILVVTVAISKPESDAILAQVMTSPFAMATIPRNGYRQVKLVDSTGGELAILDVN